MSNPNQILSSIYRSAIISVLPKNLIRSSIRIKSSDGTLEIIERSSNTQHHVQLADHDVFLFGAGKASLGMCQEFLEQIDLYNKLSQKFPIRISYGQLNVPFGSQVGNGQIFAKYNTTYYECSLNNIPDENSSRNTQQMMAWMQTHITHSLNPIVIGFISGGGSALLALPKPSVSIEDKRQLIKLLVQNGANIVELNTVRSCLSQVKHGQLAHKLFKWNPRCQLITFIISDIIGDPLEMIASGPTILTANKIPSLGPEDVLNKYSIKCDKKIQQYMKQSTSDTKLKVNSANILNIMIGNNFIALSAAKQQAEKLGFKVIMVGSDISGEARLVVRKLLDMVLEYQVTIEDTRYKGIVWLAGGETTITMDMTKHIGIGGRCQEMGLLFLNELHKTMLVDKEIFALFAGTDGQDGPTTAAGVQLKWPSKFTSRSDSWQHIHNAIEQHNSYNFWNQHANECLLRTGITGTNTIIFKMISLKTDDEDEVEISNSKKKLANLFDDDNILNEDSKSKLFYKPKQNKKVEEVQKTINQSKLNVFIALAVKVYKFDNHKYSYIGKYGIALLGNELEMIYRIILYTAKNQPICSASITESFQWICQPENFCLFQDDQRQNWSIFFSQNSDLNLFCRHISHCLYAVKFGKVSQDLDIDAFVIQPLGYHKSNEEVIKKMDSEDIICFKLQVTAFEMNCSSYSHDGSEIWIDTIEHSCLIKDNIKIIKQLFVNLNPGDINYVIIPINKFHKIKSLIPNSMIDEEKINHQSNWKLALEIQLIGFEKQKLMEESTNQPTNNQPIMDDIKPADSKTVLVNRMLRMGALPIPPLINSEHANHCQKTDIKTESCISKNLSSSNQCLDQYKDLVEMPNTIISEFWQKFLEARFDLISKSIEDLKNQIEASKSKSNILDSNLTLDSTILLNSIQKIIDENYKLKAELDEKKLELTQMNQKLFQMFKTRGSSDSGCSTPNNELTLKLKEEIIDLKDRINELKGENFRLQLEKNHLIYEDGNTSSPRLQHQLKKMFYDIHLQFGEAINTISSISENDKLIINNMLTLVLKTVARNESSSFSSSDHNHSQFDHENYISNATHHDSPEKKLDKFF